MSSSIFLAFIVGVVVLLVLILKVKLHPFLSLLLTSIIVGIVAGMPATEVFNNIKDGVGGTLGFVATIIGLGAIFGAILEHSGGATVLAHWFTNKIGNDKAPWAMMVAGFFVAIPVFFDVAFIILLPVALALKKSSGKPLLLLALPLLAGLAITHAFIPPTPGPVAVANILGANLGWVIVFGFLVGIPTAIISGPFLAKIISDKLLPHSNVDLDNTDEVNPIGPGKSPIMILGIVLLPIILIVLNTLIQQSGLLSIPNIVIKGIAILGHPFSALILANIVAWYFLGVRIGVSADELLEVSKKSFYPAGSIILLTGAGGAFKQILVTSGAGELIAQAINSTYFTPVVFSFLIAAIVRVIQGSATVAMITAAGITAPIITNVDVNEMQKAVLVISIASGATFLSHVNDSGFWLVSQYLNLKTNETFKSWTLMTSVIGLLGVLLASVIWLII